MVGHSMGGFTAPVVAARHGAGRLILVAPMIPRPGETPGAYFENVGVAEAQQAAAEAGGDDPAVEPGRTFLHDVRTTCAPSYWPRASLSSPGSSSAPFPLAAWPEVPIRVVAATRDRLGVGVEHLDSGHLPGFAHPEALARMLLGSESPHPASRSASSTRDDARTSGGTQVAG